MTVEAVRHGLTESGVNRVAPTDSLTFDVQVQNQGESEETDVSVSVTIKDGRSQRGTDDQPDRRG